MAPLGAFKYLIYSMNRLKPASATAACAGIRRMEFGQPPALGMRTCGGEAAWQWLLAMGCASKEHPSRKSPCAVGSALQSDDVQGGMVPVARYVKDGNDANWSLE